MKTLSLLLPLLAFTLLPSCSAIRAQQELRKAEAAKAEKAKPVPLYGWDNPGIKGKATVKIDLNEQKARIYDNGQEVAWTYVASGVEGRDTPTGTFHISEKKADKVSNIWGIMVDADGDTTNWNAQNGVSKVPPGGKFVGAPMPHWMRLTDTGIGMHGGSIPDPGLPASHGCIRLPYEMATLMFEALPEGTPVTVTK
jgi:lipoprotein-anchoring transpeptidase ErfK/SrfK